MNQHKLLPYGNTDAVILAADALYRLGWDIADAPNRDVTHLLLPVPTFLPDGTVRGGGNLTDILDVLPADITVCGGNLDSPLLSGFRTLDLLQDPGYLAENAAVTAHCAVKLALSQLPVTLQDCPVLVIGWGRIGKCLADLLKRMGAAVAVAARKPEDLAILRALGYGTDRSDALAFSLMRYRVIFNTVPSPVIRAEQTHHCRRGCLKIDLASTAGIAGEDVLRAGGLPGKCAPESSANLIARTVNRLAAGKES